MKHARGGTFDPGLRRVAAVLPRGLVGPRTVKVSRVLERLAERRPPPPEVEVQRVGSAVVRVHRPPRTTEDPMPAILWIHGGGYVVGSPAQDDRNCRELARVLGAVVAAVGYRKAPENPYPAALEDCHDTLAWLAARTDVDAGRVAIAGASAGGGLAAALAIAARDRGEVRPAFQLLVYPMLDDRTALRRDIDARGFRLWNNKSNRFGWRCYLGVDPGSAGIANTAAAARAEDLRGLPPAWVGVGTLDLFFEEDLDYAQRLRAAGVPCDVEVATGAFHGFDGIAPKAAVSRRFRDAQLTALASALHPH